ncbi:hypothetical protein D8I35_12105 [Corticibacter populi]|uniref:Uncharacterized protein n=1 Tax=Corticibacter populi TaxID=1550736 RepID=A0A3M6QTK6_9BURK|nr:hypothetical protein [Corticibacter populi]RMX05889.1 hypothetical protein D8I35_12105 [Corticibacter populi]RZS30792.1 hypothetical protein EV687_2986 [Corticibacter populi]
MDASATLTAAHWMYLLGVAVIVVTMIFRANVVVPSIIATVLVTFAWTGDPIGALGSVFNASFVAAKELFNIFLVIALMTALLNALKELRSDIRMVEPLRKVMKNGHISYFLLAIATYFISLFFWPTPAVPLVSAVLLPAAIAAGMPPLAGAVAIAIAGQGMALSSDYVIGVAPGISAGAAGGVASVVADQALVLSLITGLIALVFAYFTLRRQFQPANNLLLVRWQNQGSNHEAKAIEHEKPEELEEGTQHKAYIADAVQYDGAFSDSGLDHLVHDQPRRLQKWSKLFAVLTPVVFLLVMAVMILPKLVSGMPDLKGGDAAALVGGAAAVLMILATLAARGAVEMLNASADHITDGFVFAFKAMGSVLPIAGFFYLGAGETAAAILGLPAEESRSLLFELVQNAEAWIPQSQILVAFGVLVVGMITGIDGSGFSGLPLTGALSGALAPSVGMQPETLAAIGQMGAVWTGGGTLIAWSSLIAVAGFARVPVQDAVRALTLPVFLGLASATVGAVLLWG